MRPSTPPACPPRRPRRRRLASLLVVSLAALALAVAVPGEEVGRLHLPPADEPGEPLVVTGVLRGADGASRGATTLHVYQTDAAGWYRRGPEGREMGARHARLAGELVTAADGAFHLETIRPGGYPHGRTPSHIHFRIGGETGPEVTLFFEDDPRLDEATRRQIAPSGRTVFCRPERDAAGTWCCRVELRSPATP